MEPTDPKPVTRDEDPMTTQREGKTAYTTLPRLMPLKESDIPTIGSDSFLAALEEEDGIKDPGTLHRGCYEIMKQLRTNRVLDKYILNEDEAAVICAIPMLLEEEKDFSIRGMVESCKEKGPSKLIVMILTALRKLPRKRGIIYFESCRDDLMPRRRCGEILQPSFCVGSGCLDLEKEERDDVIYREVFRVEDGWGYDISEFALKRDEEGSYGKLRYKETTITKFIHIPYLVPSYESEIILFEPWSKLEVVDPGIQRSQDKISIVPLRMKETELIYEKEIVPCISPHAVKALREGIEDIEVVKRLIKILSFTQFDTKCTLKKTFPFLFLPHNSQLNKHSNR